MAETLTALPLTTIFTPPASCKSHWTYEAEFYNSIGGGLLIQDALEEHPDTDCFPTEFEGFGRAPTFVQIYSPGACPAGYGTAGNTYNGATTTAICCPSDFSYQIAFSSVNYFSTSATFEGCVSIYPRGAGLTTVLARANDADLTTTSVSGPITMWGQPISVAYQQSDLALFTTSTSSSITSTSASSSTPTSTTFSANTATSTPSSSSTTSPSSSPSPASGLSSGAIAGIAIGGAAVLGILVGLAIFVRRKKSRQARAQNAAGTEQDTFLGAQPRWISGDKTGARDQSQWPSAELDANGNPLHHKRIHEMSGRGKVEELDQNRSPVELG